MYLSSILIVLPDRAVGYRHTPGPPYLAHTVYISTLVTTVKTDIRCLSQGLVVLFKKKCMSMNIKSQQFPTSIKGDRCVLKDTETIALVCPDQKSKVSEYPERARNITLG